MKRLLCLVLLCLLLLLGGCATLSSMPVRTLENVSLPASVDTSVFTEDVPAALYFRYWDEPYLACEWRFITRTNSQSYELALLEELLSGPSAGSTELTPLFPVGTRILSVVRQGRTLFVTLSPEIMGRYADEPVDWQEYEYWLTEAPLRRRLCMQSIVATVTENCNVDQVQILVEQTGSVTGSLRLKQNYFLDDSEDDVLVGPMTRSDDMLLNCEQSMHHFLSLLQAKDWEKLYRCLSAYAHPDRVQRVHPHGVPGRAGCHHPGDRIRHAEQSAPCRTVSPRFPDDPPGRPVEGFPRPGDRMDGGGMR